VGDDHPRINDGATGRVSFFGKTIPFPLSVVLFVPLVAGLLFAALLSIPVTLIWRAVKRRQERRFAMEMKEANRLVSWAEACSFMENGPGCLIGEHLSMKGPVRLWWTHDDVSAPASGAGHFEEMPNSPESLESLNFEFEESCRSRYTCAESGTALLVNLSDTEADHAREKLADYRRQQRCVELWPPGFWAATRPATE
jgi:hypothetical protein